jgi:hypothetical protein
VRQKKESHELEEAESHSWHSSLVIGLILFMVGFMMAKAVEKGLIDWKFYLFLGKLII